MTQLNITFDPPASSNINTPNNVSPTQSIASAWVRYAHTNKLNPKTKAYKQAHHAYLCGIGQVLGEATPTIISLCMVSGRDVASLIERTQPR